MTAINTRTSHSLLFSLLLFIPANAYSQNATHTGSPTGSDSSELTHLSPTRKKHQTTAEEGETTSPNQSSQSKSSEKSARGMTGLRMSGEPVGEFVRSEGSRGGRTTLRKVSVTVRNVGDNEATDVAVQATIPGGKEVQLNGPQKLERNESAAYVATMSETIVSGDKIKAHASCANCWKR